MALAYVYNVGIEFGCRMVSTFIMFQSVSLVCRVRWAMPLKCQHISKETCFICTMFEEDVRYMLVITTIWFIASQLSELLIRKIMSRFVCVFVWGVIV